MPDTNETAKGVFLEALARSVNVSKAAEAARVSRATVYRWQREDPGFAEEWADALAGSVDLVETTAFEMATSGEHPTMTQFVLKSWLREKYGDKVEHAGRLTLAGLAQLAAEDAA